MTEQEVAVDSGGTTPTGAWAAVLRDVAWYSPTQSRSGVVACALRHRTLRPVLTLRLAQAALGLGGPGGRLLSPLARALHRRSCAGAGVDLPVETVIGPGFKITHGWGLVVSPGARLGSGVVAMHGVTVGGVAGRRFPVIEDDVFLGPGSAVLGGVRIGAGAVVGAGCVVTQDVGPGVRLSAPEPVRRDPSD